MIDDSRLENYLADLQNVPLVEAGRVREDGAISDANVFGTEPEFTLPNGVSILHVAKHAAAELLGATAYVLEAGARWADLHVRYANEEMIVVLEGTPTCAHA